MAVMECKWIFKKKCYSENKISYRARLVAKSFAQQPGIDFEEAYTPIVKTFNFIICKTRIKNYSSWCKDSFFKQVFTRKCYNETT